MGAKAQSKRRPTYKCDVCDRKFLRAQALKIHKTCMHEVNCKRKPLKVKTKLTNLLGKSVMKQGDSLATTTRMSDAKVQSKAIVPVTDEDKSVPAASETRKIQFECPQCLKLFGAYFIAYRHIQKNHCINDKGQIVLSSAADLIKPVRIEICKKCDMRVRPDNLHLCSDRFMFPNLLALTYICAGCKQSFSSIQLFDLHVSGVHCDGIESYFFPTLTEFMSWKDGVEDATDTKYLILGQSNTKQIYRCTYLPPTTHEDDKVAHICPATIVVREYSKGIQVHFYKQHHGHPSDEYRVPENYKKYTITTLMQQTKLGVLRDKKDYPEEEKQILIDPLRDETDLYVQFKSLMESLVVDAAKMNIQTLKVLIGKALEMSTVINQYVEDDDLGDVPKPTYLNKNISDNEIVGALESFRKNMHQKLANISPAPENVNKIEIRTSELSKTPMILRTSELSKTPMILRTSELSKTPMILNTFSLADESEQTPKPTAKNKILVDVKSAEDNRLNSNRRELPRLEKSKAASALKQVFKKQNIKTPDITPDKNGRGRISVRKEFMTDFNRSPNSIKTPVVESPKTAVVESPKTAVVESPKTAVVETPKTAVVQLTKTAVVESPRTAVVQSPNSLSCFNDSYKEFVVKNFKPSKNQTSDTNNTNSNNNIVATKAVKTTKGVDLAVNNKTSAAKVLLNKTSAAKVLLNKTSAAKVLLNKTSAAKVLLNKTSAAKVLLNKTSAAKVLLNKEEVGGKLLTPMRKSLNRKVHQVITPKINSKIAKMVSKKKVVKTRIGQFKPSSSPKSTEPVKVTKSPYGTRKVKADLDYEVKKQDNDCNILILKF